jgi:hypothetical protein
MGYHRGELKNDKLTKDVRFGLVINTFSIHLQGWLAFSVGLRFGPLGLPELHGGPPPETMQRLVSKLGRLQDLGASEEEALARAIFRLASYRGEELRRGSLLGPSKSLLMSALGCPDMGLAWQGALPQGR